MFRQLISRVANSFSLDIIAAKTRVQQWEPSLQLPSRPHDPKASEATPEDTYGHWFNTYTAFDPGCARPFLISGLSIGIANKDLRTAMPTSSPATKEVVVKSEKKELVKIRKPWPYSLPKALQPRAGTTYAAVYGRDLGNTVKMKRVGVFQAIVYGVPEPEKDGWKQKEGGWLHKILYGVKDDQGGGNGK